MKTLVLYDDDADGFAACYAAWLKFRDNAQYIAVERGDNPPSVEGVSDLYILDFNYSQQVMLELAQKCPNILLLDHHVSAQRELSALPFCKFDLSKSTAVIAWEHFHPDRDVPIFYGYVQDADLYQWKLPFSREVYLAVESYPRTFDFWQAMSGTECSIENQVHCVQQLMAEGEHIARFANTQIQDAVNNARLATFILQQTAPTVTPVITFDPNTAQADNTYQVPVTNATCCTSDTGHALLAKFPSSKFAAVYRDIGTGLRQWFLCSRGDFDVSEVCRAFGGGGHAAAGGFRTFHFADYGAAVRMSRTAALCDEMVNAYITRRHRRLVRA